MWVIFNTQKLDEFWSNEYGWTGLDEATQFTDEEKMNIHYLPINGKWISTQSLGY